MTAPELVARADAWWQETGKPLAAKVLPWLPLLAALVLALLLVRGCNREGAAAAELARLREAELLRATGQVVAVQVPDLRPRVAALEAENAELHAALEEARKAAPGARPVGVVSARTAPTPVHATPRSSFGAAPATSSEGGKPATPPAEACVLANGDLLRLDVDEVHLQTAGKNRLVVGTAAAWRAAPGEPALLLRAPFSAPVTEAYETPPPASLAAGWRAGPLGVLGTEGWRAGALLATPQGRLPLLGWGVEAQAGAAVGRGGGQVQAAVLFQP